jgi:hypothetical protein
MFESAPAPAILAAPLAPPSAPRPFPLVEQIVAGAGEDTLRQKYGAPDIAALTTSRGHTLGTAVYVRDRGRLATVIQLEDGRVASTYSKSAPTPPAGMSFRPY